MSQTIIFYAILFTRLHNATEVDATCSVQLEPVVATLSHQLLTARIYHGLYIEGCITKPKLILQTVEIVNFISCTGKTN